MKNWKRQIYKPVTKICLRNVEVGWGRTTYSQSYKPPGPADRNSKPTMATTKCLWPRLDIEHNRMTVHQASFREYSCADRTLPLVQGDHELVSAGSRAPMQKVTSQRHDFVFVAKCLPKAERQRANWPKVTIGTNCGSGACAMTCSTTTADAFGIPLSNGQRPSTSNDWSQDKKLLMAKDTETSTRYKQWMVGAASPRWHR
ncbi:unnamed protein product [Macrosiphum euphorbiae]|uniref:Uncharacterized protein n=1 Tax=Macrosiphum euphorbiae TaxID=13131 RepID=A0AAV0XJS4_9HEMI|nr:unnamed protein product [Macrosiphum euphorbiae]